MSGTAVTLAPAGAVSVRLEPNSRAVPDSPAASTMPSRPGGIVAEPQSTRSPAAAEGGAATTRP
ncbi:hypothetical protein ACFQV4_01830 [Streptomyces thermocarboxydus]